jgi:hypothetical protein
MLTWTTPKKDCSDIMLIKLSRKKYSCCVIFCRLRTTWSGPCDTPPVVRHAPGGAAEQSLRLGVELTLKLFDDTLAQYGVTPIEAWDHPFDPDLHEAVGLVEQPNLPPGTVAHVEQMGYTIDGSVLRPAKVLVTPG